MTDRIRVLIVDDHSVVRRGLRALLSSFDDIEVVGEAENGPSALQAAADLAPEIILLDIRMPGADGVEVAYQLRQNVPAAKIIIITAYDDDEYVVNAIRAGVYAYLQKSSSDETVVETIRLAHQGNHFLPPLSVDKVLLQFQKLARETSLRELNLSTEEVDLLKMVAQGCSNTKIAETTFWSERTVRRKIQELLAKFGASTRVQAVAEAIKRGII